MITISLLRTEAEWLVDLLEACDPKYVGTWRHDIADEIRENGGMVKRVSELPRAEQSEPSQLEKLATDCARALAMDSSHIPAIAQQVLPFLTLATSERDREIERLRSLLLDNETFRLLRESEAELTAAKQQIEQLTKRSEKSEQTIKKTHAMLLHAAHAPTPSVLTIRAALDELKI